MIHWIVGTATWADQEFQNGNGNTCYHYTIDSDGNVRQYVDDKYIAHHAGNWDWNKRAIGISLEGGYEGKGGRVKPSQKAHDTCAELVKILSEKHGFPVNRDTIKKHGEVRDRPTQCPGSTDIDYIVNKANQRIMTLLEAKRAVWNLYYEYYGTRPTTSHVYYEGKLALERGSTDILRHAYHTNREGYAHEVFRPEIYIQNNPDIGKNLKITEKTAKDNRYKLYKHFYEKGMEEGRSDTLK